MQETIIVLKFGGSVLQSVADIPTVCHEIYRWYRDGYRVPAVVSALGNSTDELSTCAQALSNDPDAFATVELLATGERKSAALMDRLPGHLIGFVVNPSGELHRALRLPSPGVPNFAFSPDEEPCT